MDSNKTLKQNIEWLLDMYKEELQAEQKQNEESRNEDYIWCYENCIMELEFALEHSKEG